MENNCHGAKLFPGDGNICLNKACLPLWPRYNSGATWSFRPLHNPEVACVTLFIGSGLLIGSRASVAEQSGFRIEQLLSKYRRIDSGCSSSTPSLSGNRRFSEPI
jgi:hypothetical protein